MESIRLHSTSLTNFLPICAFRLGDIFFFLVAVGLDTILVAACVSQGGCVSIAQVGFFIWCSPISDLLCLLKVHKTIY